MRTGLQEAFIFKIPACTGLIRCLTCIQDSFVEDFCKLDVKQRFNKCLLSHIIIQIFECLKQYDNTITLHIKVNDKTDL
jgi:hypothetical protein